MATNSEIIVCSDFSLGHHHQSNNKFFTFFCKHFSPHLSTYFFYKNYFETLLLTLELKIYSYEVRRKYWTVWRIVIQVINELRTYSIRQRTKERKPLYKIHQLLLSTLIMSVWIYIYAHKSLSLSDFQFLIFISIT